MAKAFSRPFYKSKEWQACRLSYIKSVHYLCENCLERGMYVPGHEVHHVIELTPDNITDPAITLNPDNLRYLCHECHMSIHKPRPQKRKRRPGSGRYEVTDDGSVITL